MFAVIMFMILTVAAAVIYRNTTDKFNKFVVGLAGLGVSLVSGCIAFSVLVHNLEAAISGILG